MRSQVTRPIRRAEKILKKAEHSNMKLADYDEKERDPIIAKFKKMKKKGCGCESTKKRHRKAK